jgi:hypothetical protein
MATELKAQYNVRISNDANISLSFSHIITNEQDAREVGEDDNKMMVAYMEGFGNGND